MPVSLIEFVLPMPKAPTAAMKIMKPKFKKVNVPLTKDLKGGLGPVLPLAAAVVPELAAAAVGFAPAEGLDFSLFSKIKNTFPYKTV